MQLRQPVSMNSVGNHSNSNNSKSVVNVKEKMQKTKMCSFFPRGRCKHGASCSYAHSSVELKPVPESLYKSQICPMYLAGRCTNVNCNFAHGEEERSDLFYKTSFCKDYSRGKCLKGLECRFAHGFAELRSKPTVKELAMRDSMTELRKAMSSKGSVGSTDDGISRDSESPPATPGTPLQWPKVCDTAAFDPLPCPPRALSPSRTARRLEPPFRSERPTQPRHLGMSLRIVEDAANAPGSGGLRIGEPRQEPASGGAGAKGATQGDLSGSRPGMAWQAPVQKPLHIGTHGGHLTAAKKFPSKSEPMKLLIVNGVVTAVPAVGGLCAEDVLGFCTV